MTVGIVVVALFVGFGVVVGEVEVLLSERGCIGVMGMELDRLRGRLFWGFRRSSPEFCRRHGVEGWAGGAGLDASVSDLRATLIMCAASAAFSFGDNSSFLLVVVAPRPVPVALPRVVVVVVFFFCAVDCASASVARSSLRSTVVVDVHVAVDPAAALTASTLLCNEVIRLYVYGS